jgi:hypothetical protein
MVMLFAWAPAQANTAKKITVIHARMFSPTNQIHQPKSKTIAMGPFFTKSTLTRKMPYVQTTSSV